MLKNILSVLSGAVGAQLIALAVAPIITRIYLPEEYGVMATVWALIGIAGIIACLSYEKTIVLEASNTDARRLVKVCICLALGMSMAVSVVVFIYDEFVNAEYFRIGYVYLFVFIGVVVFGARKALDAYATREQRFHLISVSMIMGASLAAGWKIGAGLLWGASAEVLLMGNIIGTMVPVTVLYWFSRKILRVSDDGVNRDRIGGLLHRHSDFPKKQVPNAILNGIQEHSPVFILAAYFGSEVVGLYVLAAAVLLRPVRALAEAISRVYLQRASRLARETIQEDLLRVTLRVGLLAVPCSVILFVFGEILFRLLFGEQWGDAGQMASLMAPWVFIVILKIPVSQVMLARRELKFILFFNAAYMLLRVSGLMVSIYITKDVFSALFVFALIGFIANAFFILRGFSIAGK